MTLIEKYNKKINSKNIYSGLLLKTTFYTNYYLYRHLPEYNLRLAETANQCDKYKYMDFRLELFSTITITLTKRYFNHWKISHVKHSFGVDILSDKVLSAFLCSLLQIIPRDLVYIQMNKSIEDYNALHKDDPNVSFLPRVNFEYSGGHIIHLREK